MAECGICGQDKPAKRTQQVYTAIQQQSTRKSGYKEYETKTRFHGFKDHTYNICADCIRRNKTYSLALWLPAIFVIAPLLMWLLFPKGQGQGGATEVLCFASAISPFLPLLLAYWIWSDFLNLNKKLVKKAVAARQASNWRDEVDRVPNLHQDTKAEKYIGIQGFTEVQYKKIQRNS